MSEGTCNLRQKGTLALASCACSKLSYRMHWLRSASAQWSTTNSLKKTTALKQITALKVPMVQKGKFAAWAASDPTRALKRVLLPTLGSPTIPVWSLPIEKARWDSRWDMRSAHLRLRGNIRDGRNISFVFLDLTRDRFSRPTAQRHQQLQRITSFNDRVDGNYARSAVHCLAFSIQDSRWCVPRGKCELQ